MNSDKKVREPNFTSSEKMHLMNIIANKYALILEDKKTDRASTSAKLKTWQVVEEEFNASSTSSTYRNATCLRKCYENRKKELRKSVAQERREMMLTGGGPPTKIKKDDTDDLLISILNKKTLLGLNNRYDDDADESVIATNTNEDQDLIFEYAYESDEGEKREPLSKNVTPAERHNSPEITLKRPDNGIPSTSKDWNKYIPKQLQTPINPALGFTESVSEKDVSKDNKYKYIKMENDMLEDDLEILEIIEHGFPRQIYERANYIQSMDDLSFFKRFRLRKETVLQVLIEIEPQLEYPYDRNNAVSPINQLLITLRCYATGTHLLAIGDFSGVHVSTACRIVKKVSEAIAGLYERYIKFPSTNEEIMQAQRQFFDIAAFPRVVGAIDGTHVRIQSPGGEDAEIFRNRKGYFSINVQGVTSANLKFINIIARWPGSTHDVTIFNNSVLRAQFENNRFRNALLLGDSGYNIRPYLLTPLLQPQTQEQQRYNESHIRTRNSVERLFGVWKRRFPIMAYGCRLKLENALTVIIATAVLHNIAQNMNEDEPPCPDNVNRHELDQLINAGQIPHIPLPNNGVGIAAGVRTTFINQYFATV